ncbi:MAG TPA: hypothetical protein VKU41_12505, partial [Polyangiaceae bacterium]|nr:hypothetical protein [Polyangiaceae bacterium]
LADDIPLELTTRVELHVAGKNREELLGKVLPPGFVPMSLAGPLPARLEADGRLRIQVRPGIYTLELVARSGGSVTSVTRPAPEGPWRQGEEVWVFEAHNDYRVVTVEGVASIDPQQTTLPDAWKRLPAYPMKVGAALALVEKRRGDADPPPDQLSLDRTMWLDFDGAGYSVSDKVTGSLSRESRLTMAPPTLLGRVAIGGRDQFITHVAGDDRAGVEVRRGDLSVTADSRIPGDPGEIPAVGWAHDFHQVSGALHLPPGWRLLHASGVDDVPGTWVRRWSLVDLFLALIVAIGIGRLYRPAWGVVALVLLVLTLPESEAPKWSWLFVLAAEALWRVVPAGKAKALFAGVRLGAVVLVAIVAVPFLVQHVREGMYPALAEGSSAGVAQDEDAAGVVRAGMGTGAKGEEGSMGNPAEPPAPAAGLGAGAAASAPAPAQAAPSDLERQQKFDEKATVLRRGAPAASGSSSLAYRQSNSQVYDPAAVVQTGPGLPKWRWTTLDLRWSGPVASTQRVRLYLLSPRTNLVLALARAALLVLVVLRLSPWRPRGGRAAAAALAGAALWLLPGAARADLPDAPMLQDLAERLTRKPDCAPSCASSGRMRLEVTDRTLRARLEVDAATSTAVPLPGTGGEWTPSDVLVDGRPAKGLLRTDDGILWVEVAAGNRQISVEGPLPDRETVALALHLKPHRVDVSAVGWAVAGVHEDGLADDNLELTRTVKRAGDAGASLQPGTLPPFVRVERTLEAGLDWQVDTRVARVTPAGSAVVLEVPLLAGESVTTPDVRVEGGKALVNMAPQVKEIVWHSVLEQRSPVTLVAPKTLAWIEVWRVDVGPVWHSSFSGIVQVHTQPVAGARVPEWRPWPGEQVIVDLVRPDGVSGQTLTIDESSTELRPGLRATDGTLTLSLRASRGAEHTITLPPGAQLEALSINGATQPVRQQGDRVTVPIAPGAQSVSLSWREGRGLTSLFGTSRLDLGAPSVNATATLVVPGGRWLLFAAGPRVGPAVLFWSLLLVLAVVSIVLGANRWTPLRWWHWLLLCVGLSQVSIEAGAVFVGWLLALGWRSRLRGETIGVAAFDLLQALLVCWTLAALGILAVSLYQGLLGAPEMQVRGNGSSADALHWFTDRSGPTLPGAWMLSVPILVYRGAMLAWALWIALALLAWLRWGWDAFTAGGAWRRRPPRPVFVPSPPSPPYAPPASPPVGGPPPGAPPPT